MAKGDYVEVAMQIGDSQALFRVDAVGAGQKVEHEWVTPSKGHARLRVSQLTRNGNPIVVHEFAADTVLRVSSKVKAE